MALQDVPCPDCKHPVIRAQTDRGVAVVTEIDPTLTGKWKLTERPGGTTLASVPSPKFAFGMKLYPVHVCTGARWRKK